MPTYLPFRYSSRSAYPAGLASLRSARAARRRRRMLGQDGTDFLPPDIGVAPIDVAPPPLMFPSPGPIDVTEPPVSGTLYDPYTQQPLTAAQQYGSQPVVPITGIPGKPGVTYTSAPASGLTSSFSAWAAKKNSVLGLSNGSLLFGAGAIALLAAAAGGKR